MAKTSFVRDTNRSGGLSRLKRLKVECHKIGGGKPVLRVEGTPLRGPWDPSAGALYTRAAQRHFEFPALRGDGTYRVGTAVAGPGDLDRILARKRLSAYRDEATGLVRLLYREIVLGLAPGVGAPDLSVLLARHGLGLRPFLRFDGPSVIAYGIDPHCDGDSLLDCCESLLTREWVTHAAPNFVSQYRRCGSTGATTTATRDQVWHLLRVNAAGAWKVQMGDPAIVVSIVDDGVDVRHPVLMPSIHMHPDSLEPMDLFGRNFCVDDDHPDHFDPRPSRFEGNATDSSTNDIHGTACAGVAAAAGPQAWGMAPGCHILPVKVFPTSDPMADHQVARGIRYAALHSDVVCCSWSGPASDDIASALQDAARFGRQGRGCVVVCAAGNAPAGIKFGGPVSFPAVVSGCIAVGASTSTDEVADYSNRGPQISVVAPTERADRDAIFTTDVSAKGRGFDPGGGVAGQFTGQFGGTSSAAAMVAGLAALILSRRPALRSSEVREIIERNAAQIGTGDRRIDAAATLLAIR